MGIRIPDAHGPGERILPPYILLKDNKPVILKKKFYDQKRSNVAYAGSSVLTFVDGKWKRTEFKQLAFGAVSELPFVVDNEIYLLIHTAGNTLQFLSLYKWENDTFVEISLSGPAEKYLNDSRVPQVGVAGGKTADGHSILYHTSKEGDITFYNLMLRYGVAEIEETGTISSSLNTKNAEIILADVHENTLIITTGVEHQQHRELFFWDEQTIILFDLYEKTTKMLTVALPFTPFTGIGPTASYFNPKTGSWILAGHMQKGDGSTGVIWSLPNILKPNASLAWTVYERLIADGEHVFDNDTVYTVTRGKMTSMNLGQL